MANGKLTIKDLGEFGLIDRIAKKVDDNDLVKGIGDDCAVVKMKEMQVLTTDCMVEGDHFSRAWFTPEQIGMKAIETNISDIAAMGALPRFGLVSLALPDNLEVEFVERMYAGMWKSCQDYDTHIIGGNMARSRQIVISVTLIGEVGRPNLSLRSDAEPGDSIFVTGHLGNGRAGLRLFQEGIEGYEKIKKLYTCPKAQVRKALRNAPYANAMEDISDGLASEIKHICAESGCGARIRRDKIPIYDEVRQIAAALQEDEYEYALSGGEDFQLVFTVAEKNLGEVEGVCVGETTKDKSIKLCYGDAEVEINGKGYDQFSNHI